MLSDLLAVAAESSVEEDWVVSKLRGKGAMVIEIGHGCGGTGYLSAGPFTSPLNGLTGSRDHFSVLVSSNRSLLLSDSSSKVFSLISSPLISL